MQFAYNIWKSPPCLVLLLLDTVSLEGCGFKLPSIVCAFGAIEMWKSPEGPAPPGQASTCGPHPRWRCPCWLLASVRPCVRASVRPCIRASCFLHPAHSSSLMQEEGLSLGPQRIAGQGSPGWTGVRPRCPIPSPEAEGRQGCLSPEAFSGYSGPMRVHAGGISGWMLLSERWKLSLQLLARECEFTELSTCRIMIKGASCKRKMEVEIISFSKGILVVGLNCLLWTKLPFLKADESWHPCSRREIPGWAISFKPWGNGELPMGGVAPWSTLSDTLYCPLEDQDALPSGPTCPFQGGVLPHCRALAVMRKEPDECGPQCLLPSVTA